MKKVLSFCLAITVFISGIPYKSYAQVTENNDDKDIAYVYESYEYRYLSDDSISIVEYDSTMDANTEYLTIPTTINEIPVVSLDQDSFAYAEMETLLVPESIVSIDNAAFIIAKI